MDEWTSRAVTAYFRRHGEGADQPADGLSGIVNHEGLLYVELRNVNGPLAMYRVTNRGQLKYLKRWPFVRESDRVDAINRLDYPETRSS